MQKNRTEIMRTADPYLFIVYLHPSKLIKNTSQPPLYHSQCFMSLSIFSESKAGVFSADQPVEEKMKKCSLEKEK